jgi:antagonist of KipI
VLRFGERRGGARAYIAFDGGVDVPVVLGSRATHVLSALGGLNGRALAAGDRLAIGESERSEPQLASVQTREPLRIARAHPPVRPAESNGARLRVMRGPQVDHFDERAFDALQRTRFTVSPQSNRMGYRLVGANATIGATGGDDGGMISDAAFIGGIQVPPSGDPILLMADRQTTGGYPQIATVIAADLPLAGQLAPGDWIEFSFCSRAEAIDALRALDASLLAEEARLRGI